jgi:RimJ/RimL family protein N-acetyltransferase
VTLLAPAANVRGMDIESARLRLLALDPAFLRASLEGRHADAERRLGARLPEPWPQLPDVLRLRLAQIEQDPASAPWLTRLVVSKADARLAGVAGFHGPPGGAWLRDFAPQGVELGYTIFERDRRRGFAREACAALIGWAAAQGVREFVLSIAPGNEASAALARQQGFTQVGTWVHDTRGEEHVYRLRLAKT